MKQHDCLKKDVLWTEHIYTGLNNFLSDVREHLRLKAPN